MSLTFLVPLFLLGLAGIAVPIVVHLTRKQRKNVVAFPSLMFLEKVPFQEQRRRRIQNWFLLSLRALALCLLAFAFARPFLDDPALAAGGGGGPREVVVLLDQSYSMAVGDRWERAVQEARTAFAGLGPLDRASLVLFSQGARVVARSTSDPTRLDRALGEARVGSGTTRYGPGLKVAQTILEESTLPSGEVYMVSDFQRIGWTGDEGVRLPPGSVVTPVVIQTEIPDNIQVTDVSLARQAASGRERVTATARVARQGGGGPIEVPVSLEIDGQELQSQSVRLMPDGSATVSFSPFTLSQPHTRGSVRVPTDAVEADDARHFVLSPGNSLTVVIAEGSRADRDASLYVRRALETSEEGRFRVRVRRGDSVRPEDLDGTDVLVMNDARVDGGSAQLLRNFVEGGGGVLVVLGAAATWPTSGADLLPGSLGPVEDREEGRGGRLGFLEYGHPVFEAFAGPRSGDFSGARFFRARRLTPTDSAVVTARFDDGSVAMAEATRGRGTVMAWTSTLDVYWNDLALQPVFLPFVHRVTEYLSGRAEPFQWFTTGQVVDLASPDALETAGLASPVAAGLSGVGERVVLTPSATTLPLASGDGAGFLTLEERGFYVVRPPGTDPERPFVMAVNVDLTESSPAGLDPQELISQVTAPAVETAAGPEFEALELRREDRERRQSLWRYLLIGAFALFLVETTLSNWLSRRGSGTRGVAIG